MSDGLCSKPGREMGGEAYHKLKLLAGVATDLLRFKNAVQLFESVFARLSAETRADLCFCYLVEGERLHLAFAGGVAEHLRPSIEWLDFGEGACGKAARERCQFRFEDIQESESSSTAFLKSLGVQSFCCYPLMVDGRLLGTQSFGTRDRAPFERDELELQRAIADQVAVASDRILLMQELARNNRALAATNDELRRANTDLEQFAFSVSHDLREPLRQLSIYAELLQKRAESNLNADAKRYLSFVYSSAKRMDLLVHDLLTYTRAVNVAPASTRVETNAVLDQVIAKLHPAITDSEAVIRTERLPALMISAHDLADLFGHLLDNAIKYRRPGIPPEIHIFSRKCASGDTAVCVQDNGIGIAPEHRNRIFGLFKRLHSSARYDGSGIGLAICQKIVERYKGQIWVDPEIGTGALFCFILNEQSTIKSFSASASISS